MTTTTFNIPATVMHFEAGDALFCYLLPVLSHSKNRVCSDPIFCGKTLLCKVLTANAKYVGEFMRGFAVTYDLQIMDAEDTTLIGRQFQAGERDGVFNTVQSRANYFSCNSGFDPQPLPLRLLKAVKNPETSFLHTENGMLHIGIAGQQQSHLYPLHRFETADIERLRELLPVIVSTLYCTIGLDDSGYKIKGLSVTYRNSDAEETWGIPM